MTSTIDVDMAVVNEGRHKIFSSVLGGPTPHCPVETVDLDVLDEDRSLKVALGQTRFDASAPTFFICEGLIMYLGSVGKFKLLADLTAVAAPGSILVLQFMEASEKATAANPGASEHALSVVEATRELTMHGWEDLKVRLAQRVCLKVTRNPNPAALSRTCS